MTIKADATLRMDLELRDLASQVLREFGGQVKQVGVQLGRDAQQAAVAVDAIDTALVNAAQGARDFGVAIDSATAGGGAEVEALAQDAQALVTEVGQVTPAAQEMGAALVTAGRDARAATAAVTPEVRSLTARLREMGATALSSIGQGLVQTLKSAIGPAAILGSVFGAGLGLRGGVTAAKEFSTAMVEVSTLVDTTRVDVDALAASVLNLARAQGTNEAEQARGLYQTISAGITDTAEAQVFLAEASTLAVGGLAQTAQAVDILSTVLNAYGREVADTREISDQLFATVQVGKTTIPELSEALGRTIPLAAALGIEFKEVAAAVGTLTAGGIGTREAVTGLRAIFNSILRPSEQAREVMAAYGLSLSSANVEALGLAGVLSLVRDRVGDNSEALTALFGSVEAITPALALVGSQAGAFARNLDSITNSAGAAGTAAEKILADPFRQLQAFFGSVRISAVELVREVMPGVIAFGREIGGAFAPLAGVGREVLGLVGELALVTGGVLVGALRVATPVIAGVAAALEGVLSVAGQVVGGIRSVLQELGGALGLVETAEARKQIEDLSRGAQRMFTVVRTEGGGAKLVMREIADETDAAGLAASATEKRYAELAARLRQIGEIERENALGRRSTVQVAQKIDPAEIRRLVESFPETRLQFGVEIDPDAARVLNREIAELAESGRLLALTEGLAIEIPAGVDAKAFEGALREALNGAFADGLSQQEAVEAIAALAGTLRVAAKDGGTLVAREFKSATIAEFGRRTGELDARTALAGLVDAAQFGTGAVAELRRELQATSTVVDDLRKSFPEIAAQGLTIISPRFEVDAAALQRQVDEALAGIKSRVGLELTFDGGDIAVREVDLLAAGIEDLTAGLRDGSHTAAEFGQKVADLAESAQKGLDKAAVALLRQIDAQGELRQLQIQLLEGSNAELALIEDLRLAEQRRAAESLRAGDIDRAGYQERLGLIEQVIGKLRDQATAAEEARRAANVRLVQDTVASLELEGAQEAAQDAADLAREIGNVGRQVEALDALTEASIAGIQRKGQAEIEATRQRLTDAGAEADAVERATAAIEASIQRRIDARRRQGEASVQAVEQEARDARAQVEAALSGVSLGLLDAMAGLEGQAAELGLTAGASFAASLEGRLAAIRVLDEQDLANLARSLELQGASAEEVDRVVRLEERRQEVVRETLRLRGEAVRLQEVERGRQAQEAGLGLQAEIAGVLAGLEADAIAAGAAIDRGLGSALERQIELVRALGQIDRERARVSLTALGLEGDALNAVLVLMRQREALDEQAARTARAQQIVSAGQVTAVDQYRAAVEAAVVAQLALGDIDAAGAQGAMREAFEGSAAAAEGARRALQDYARAAGDDFDAGVRAAQGGLQALEGSFGSAFRALREGEDVADAFFRTLLEGLARTAEQDLARRLTGGLAGLLGGDQETPDVSGIGGAGDVDGAGVAAAAALEAGGAAAAISITGAGSAAELSLVTGGQAGGFALETGATAAGFSLETGAGLAASALEAGGAAAAAAILTAATEAAGLLGLGSIASAVGGAGGEFNGTGALLEFATGGIMPGARVAAASLGLPLRTYSNGGVARRPQVALYAEVPGMAEAFVPLPDGQNIPARVEFDTRTIAALESVTGGSRFDLPDLRGPAGRSGRDGNVGVAEGGNVVTIAPRIEVRTTINIEGGGESDGKLRQALAEHERKMPAIIAAAVSQGTAPGSRELRDSIRGLGR